MRIIFLAAAFLACGPTLSRAQAPVVGIWELDETSGLVATDSGPRGSHGHLLGFTNDPAQWVAGRLGNGLLFDGADDQVRLAGRPFYTGLGASFSVCFWVNGTAVSDERVLCLGSSMSDTPLFSFGCGLATAGGVDKLRVYARNQQNQSSARYSSVPVFDQTWHHVAYVETSGQARLYIDGVLDPALMDDRFGLRGTRTATHGTYPFDLVALGAVVRPSSCCFWNGILDSVHIYSCAIGASDVAIVRGGGRASACAPSMGEYGLGCGPGPLELYGAGSPILGGSGLFFTMRGAAPFASASLNIGSSPLAPLDLGGFGLSGCTLYDPSATLIAVGACDAFGSFNGIGIPVPNLPGLLNAVINFQGITVAPGSILTSHAVLAVLAR
ncbi:MAG: LamG domain-containing protein [Planctomycetes bacterium]|nr:LamG domain-containing protein [Planctomycetota bacterium]